MPFPRDDSVVSPELALVDEELAWRLRSLPVEPPAARMSSRPQAERSFVWRSEPSGRSPRRTRTVARAVAAIAAAVAFLLYGASTIEGPPTEASRPLVSTTPPGEVTKPKPKSKLSAPRRSATTEPKRVAEPSGPRTGTTRARTAPSPPSARDTDAWTTRPPRTTRLSWTGTGWASSYELVLVRNGKQILFRTPSSADVEIPRTWTHAGHTYGIRPEDQAYVWAVVDGRRSGRALVDGALALDLMLGETFPS